MSQFKCYKNLNTFCRKFFFTCNRGGENVWHLEGLTPSTTPSITSSTTPSTTTSTDQNTATSTTPSTTQRFRAILWAFLEVVLARVLIGIIWGEPGSRERGTGIYLSTSCHQDSSRNVDCRFLTGESHLDYQRGEAAAHKLEEVAPLVLDPSSCY